MESLANSRKLNGISLIDYLQVTERENRQISPLVRSPTMDGALVERYNTLDNEAYNPVSKSFRTFLKKLRGNASNDNKSLLVSPAVEDKRILVPSSRALNSKHEPIKPKKMSKSAKNYHLPTIETTQATGRRRGASYHRHTVDLTHCDFNDDSGVVTTKCNGNNSSSIYSTFTTTNKDSLITTSSSCYSSISSFSGETSSFNSSCMKRTNNTVQNLTDLAVTQTEDELLQQKLWNEDTSICPKEEIAQWLGSKPDTRSNVLRLYMKNYDFSGLRLDEAFRTLCSKLYLKGESQQLDRIIEAFSKRYYECNPHTLLHCVDVVHAIAYSLLLLNTDLHIVNDWTNKMTRTSFIKNTMETIQTLMFPHSENTDTFIKQRKRRASLVSHQSDNSYRVKRAESVSPSSSFFFDEMEVNNNSSLIVNTFDALKSNLSRKSSTLHHDGGISRTQKAWLADVECLLKDMYAAVKSHRIDQASAPSNNNDKDPAHTSADVTTLQRSRTLPKNEKPTSKNQSIRRRRGYSVINPLDVEDLVIETKELASLPVSLLKQGLVMRKHVMESTDKRARHRQWQLCYLVMSETELIMYRPIHQDQQQTNSLGKTARRRRRSMMLWNQSIYSLHDIIAQGDMEDWQADMEQEPLDKLEMNHTHASAIPPPGWNGHRPHVFRMETADGGLWLFESVDMFAIQAWVEAANATAARISKGPLTGAVSNIDYGWGAKWDNSTEEFTSENIPVWYPPSPCMINSNLDLKDQYKDIQAQIKNFNVQLNEHRQLKLFLDKKFSATGNQHVLNSMQALTNWDRKLHYILHELIKLKSYKESLEIIIRDTTMSNTTIV